jgi:hypothetical protein
MMAYPDVMFDAVNFKKRHKYATSHATALIRTALTRSASQSHPLRTRRSFKPPCHHALAEKLREASKRLLGA